MHTVDAKETYETGLLYHHYANTAYPLTPQSFMEYRINNDAKIPAFILSEWNKTDELSLYVHVPFCKLRCKFCEYAVLENTDTCAEDLYVSLLLKEIAMYQKILKGKKIVGYDLGGGTPTKLTIDNLKKITHAIKNSFQIESDVVFSVETTPIIASNEPEKIKEVYNMGYKRISMGIQTISEKLLNDLGREGTTHIYEKAVQNIRSAGFKKFNVDIMYGFLHQNDDELENTLKYAIGLNPDYITLYRNRYKGTKIESEAVGVSLYKIIRQYRLAYKILTANGYAANVGKNTFSKVSNDYGTSDYLTKRVIEGTPYVGMGLGAHSFGIDYLSYNEGAATKTLANYKEKIENNQLPIQDIYQLPKDESITKMVSVAFYFGFVDLEAFKKRFGIPFIDKFKDEIMFLIDNGLMELKDNRIILTERGADYVNGVIPLFYSERSKHELLSLFMKTHDQLKGEEQFLKAYSQSDYERPSVATDMAVFTIVDKDSSDYRKLPEKEFSVLLIRRGEHPYMNSWALPGGFVRMGETIEETAYRELREEAGLDSVSLSQLHVFSQPKRDPRGWIISCSFMALAESQRFNLKSGDDALEAKWFKVNYTLVGSNKEKKQYNLILSAGTITLTAKIETRSSKFPNTRESEYNISETTGIAFDHAKILAYAITNLRNNLNASMLAFELLQEPFTLTDLQKVYEVILDEKLLTANFRRKISDYVEETDMVVDGAGHRPAKLYKRKELI